MDNIINLLFKLIKSAVDNSSLDEDIQLSQEQERQLYVLAKKHDMAHLVSYALDKNGISLKNEEVLKKFQKQHIMAVFRYERQAYDFDQLCALFNELKIRFIPLKGAVIREMYPEPWMRTSCDIDILIDETNMLKAQQALQERLGYSFDTLGDHDVSFVTTSGVHFELHYSLLDNRNEDKYLKNIWKYAYSKYDSGSEYVLSDEMLYYYHIFHMAKHFLKGGCGIKPFLDIWLFNKNELCVCNFKDGFLRKSGFYCFAESSEKLSRIWFEGEKCDELSSKMQMYILGGGVYGNITNKQSMNKQRSKSSFRYNLSRIWLPTSVMKLHYPKLERSMWLLPFYQIKRWIRILFSFKTRSKTQTDTISSNAENEKLVVDLIKNLNL